MKSMHNLKRLTALCTALFVLAAMFMALPLTASAEGVTVGDIVYTVNGESSNDPSTPSDGDTIVAKLWVSGQPATETDAVLISALYNDNVLTQVEVSKPGAAAQGATLTTTIEVPEDTEGASWSYRSFVWNLTDTLTPYEPTNALLLHGENRVNAAYLAWDAVDGNLSEPLYVYKDGEKVADVTIPAGKGEWAEYVVADGATSHNYYVQNAEGTRKSNTVTVTPAKADDLLKASAWATPAIHPGAPEAVAKTRADGTTAHDMLEPVDGAITYDSGKSAFVWNNSNYATAVATPNGAGYSDNAQQFASPDGKSYAWILAPYYRGSNLIGKDNNLAFTATKSKAENKYDFSFAAGEADEKFSKDIRDFTILIEYWGEKTTNFVMHYATGNYPLINENLDDVSVKHAQFVLNPSANSQWKAARMDLHNVYGGYIPTSGAFHWTNHIGIGSGENETTDRAYIRKVIMVPTEEINKAGGILPESLFVAADTLENYQGKFVPARQMRDLTQDTTPALQLTADNSSLNAVSLTWDATDGNVSDTLKVYRNGSEIATIEAGKGDYVDYMVADGQAEYQYQIKSETNPSRVSNTVAVTPKSAKDLLDKSAWADANVYPDLINEEGKNVHYHDLYNNGEPGTISKFAYNPTEVKKAETNNKKQDGEWANLTSFYNGGGTFKNGVGYSASNFACGIATKDGKNNDPEAEFLKSPDGKSAAWVLAPYCRYNNKLPGTVPFTLAKDNVIDQEHEKFAPKEAEKQAGQRSATANNYNVLVEYWGTKVNPFNMEYANMAFKDDIRDRGADSVTEPIKPELRKTTVQLPVSGDSAEEWEITYKVIDKAWLGYIGHQTKPDDNNKTHGDTQAIQNACQITISSGENDAANAAYIRKVIVIDSADLRPLFRQGTTFQPKALFLTTENQDEVQYQYTPTRTMRAWVD